MSRPVLIDGLAISSPSRSDQAMPDQVQRDLPQRDAPRWKGPTVAQIAALSGVGTATVDRVLNGRGAVRDATRVRVLEALARLDGRTAPALPADRLRIGVLVDAGVSFNRTLEQAVAAYGEGDASVDLDFLGFPTPDMVAVRFAQLVERCAQTAHGLIVVAREDLTINRALRAASARGVHVVCLTTDLPTSGRAAYVGSDQASAGATAAYLMGRLLGGRPGRILLVYSAPYRCQEERELGFRRVLRSEFGNIEIEERVNSNDRSESARENIFRYIADRGPPAGIYNLGGGNVGVARALEQHDLLGRVLFVGHELNPNSRMLLESGAMDIVVGHDVEAELQLSIELIRTRVAGAKASASIRTPVRVFTKYSCG
jgi:LacI family transcriptional regulator